jgi:hypothetical protein
MLAFVGPQEQYSPPSLAATVNHHREKSSFSEPFATEAQKTQVFNHPATSKNSAFINVLDAIGIGAPQKLSFNQLFTKSAKRLSLLEPPTFRSQET